MFRRKATRDRSPQSLRFYTVEQLGDKQSLTPEGFLVVLDVPICRTGVLVYGPGEVPIPAGMDGTIRVVRDEAEVFSPEHIASYAGKSITNDHPEDDVDPRNWRQHEVGVAMNPRRGEGLQSDLLLADFLIKDPVAIQDVRDGKREVSCGYNADYDETARGQARQYNLFGNHVALVDKGRCGQRCAIGDKKTVTLPEEEDPMKTRDNKSKFADTMLGKLMAKAFAAKDEAALAEVMKDAEAETPDDDATHIHVHAGAARDSKDNDIESFMAANEQDHQEFRDQIASLTARLDGVTKDAEEAKKAGDKTDEEDKVVQDDLMAESPAGTADKAAKARDSVYLEDSFQDTVAAAEILVPGIRIPTFDKAAAPKASLDTICKLRRTALDLAYNTAEGRGLIEELNGKALELSGMKCAEVRTLFRSAVTARKAANSLQNQRSNDVTTAGKPVKGAIMSLAELNKRNAEAYAIK